jgi:hypothetical protein
MTTVAQGRHRRHRQIVMMEGMAALVDKTVMFRVVAVRRR